MRIVCRLFQAERAVFQFIFRGDTAKRHLVICFNARIADLCTERTKSFQKRGRIEFAAYRNIAGNERTKTLKQFFGENVSDTLRRIRTTLTDVPEDS